MSDLFYQQADDRALILVEGPDREAFLQGLISNDVSKASAERAIWAAFLTPQGKYLHDFFVVASGEQLLLDCEMARRDDLMRRLKIYKLRSKVSVAAVEDGWGVFLLFGDDPAGALNLPTDPGAARPVEAGSGFVDPRLSVAGARILAPRSAAQALLGKLGAKPAEAGAYDRLRISLGLPDGSRDMEVDKAILLENGFDELAGVDWKKGCFMGQELTARTKYRGLVKKRLLPVTVEGPAPAPGTPIMLDGKEAGEVRSGNADIALALLRLEPLRQAQETGLPLMAGTATLTPHRPGWLRMPG